MAEASPSEDYDYTLAAGSEVTFDIVCTPCDTDGDIKEAEGYCSDCHEYLCAQCLKYHKKVTTTKYHALMDKDSMPGTQGASHVNDVCKQRCQVHRNEIIKYYCPSHKTVGCGDCMLRTHHMCPPKVYIPDEANKLTGTDEFKNFQTLTEKLTNKSENLLKSVHINMESVSAFRVNALQEIETYRQEVNDALDKLKAALEEQTEEIAGREEAAMSLMAEQTHQIQNELQRMTTEFKTLLNKKQHCQMFIEMKTSEAKLVQLQKQIEEAENRRLTYFRFIPSEDLKKLIGKKDALGKLLVKTADDMSASRVTDFVVMSLKNKKRSTCRITGMALLSKDRIVIADRDSATVKLIDTDIRQMISEYKPEVAPCDVTRANNNQVAVTLPNAKKILVMSSENTLNIDNEIQVNQTCWFIASIDEKLVVSFTNPEEVRMLSMAGDVLKAIVPPSRGDLLICNAPRLAVSSDTQAIYASEWDWNRVIMLDMDGNLLAEYKDDALKNPAYSAIGDMGMVYVCCRVSNKIHLLKPYCSKVKILLTEADGIKSPLSMCYCDVTKRLYVAMEGSNTITVYQIS